ncbi:malto-oligosyltrehalose synthase [Streptantibioticus silvisoli]|uniref:Malto-oligosyltrehalose synthase n=1 Tax=Streptantibioticus silvisoli TaxID=2705255 RepID=A0ABT6W0C2_9ACTN|nr:malto-oligosyltrehalose synthase [Streptantibioticus silvisoli]MDI5964196.1 malto-oligosyltrehalose synthase [Streptantibioticus silvisoli]
MSAAAVPAPPTATYRLQIQPGFGFAAAEAAVPYLASLGVSHLHLSPVLEAVPGSPHGYDVVAHDRVREELGGEAGLRSLSAAARAHGLGLVLDCVPNHMAVPAPERLNAPLWDVLRNGPGSAYAHWFDIDWAAGGGTVMLPVLGGEPADEAAAMRVQDGELRYYEHAFPLRPGTEQLPLPRLLAAQHYTLAYWRRARTELNYRRFFTVSELIGVRVEHRDVFDATHGTLLRLLAQGVADGLRIDHPDGLADPAGYLDRLREGCGGRWTVVEKILCGDEALPDGWSCDGTTGYDALRRIDGLFTDPAGVRELVGVYREFTGAAADRGGEWAPTARRAAYRVVTGDLAAEVARLGRAAGTARPDLPPAALGDAIREVLVRMPVYRPYDGDPRSAAVMNAVAASAGAAAADEAGVRAVEAVRDLALRRAGAGAAAEDFAVRFAQVASAAHAKAAEDCAFYRYVPLLSLNEVGGEPGEPGTSVAGFHAFCADRQARWPLTGNVLSTHDTKRSADVRARIAALSQDPPAWAGLLARATALTGERGPDPHVEYLAWQTAFGLGSPDAARLKPAILKSVREAALHTSWTDGDPAYEAAVEAFVEAGPCGPARHDLAELAGALRTATEANALGAALVHLTMPGVPDVYQGTEDDYAALVDPDNRAPARFGPPLPRALSGGADDGITAGSPVKVRMTALALRLRREWPAAFGADGGYLPLTADGPAADHLVAFARGGRVVTAVTRLSRRLADAGGWRETALTLPPGRWHELLTGRDLEGTVTARELFAGHPVALLRAG